jgi:hypothetical protein
MHPLPLTSCGYYASTSKICKVSGDLWLWLAQDFDKVADAKFLLSHEIHEPQASVVTQSLKEAFQAESLLCCHALEYIRFDRCIATVLYSHTRM